MKKALISGYNGFIAKHLREELFKRNIESVALSRFELYLNPPQLTELIFHHKPNYIFLLHAYGNHRNQTDETKAVMANYFATWNIIKATEFLEYDTLINFGSSSCYGIKDHAMSETDNFEPDTFYAATKAGMIHLTRAFAKQYDRPICSVVPFSVFGEGELPNRLIPAVCEHLVTSQPLSVTLTPTHDWVYVKDFINGVMLAVDNIQKLKGETLNIGTGIARSNQEIINKLEKISGKKLHRGNDTIFHQFDSSLWQADIAKLKSLGWKQTVSIDEGLERCFKYYSKKLQDNKND